MSAVDVLNGAESVRGLQERAARAQPAVHVERVDGWWLRHAPRRAWWVGSVLPHGDTAPDELERRVEAAEAFYARHGVPARFQVNPPACPTGLDALLAERGYHRAGPMSMRVAATASVRGRTPAGAPPVRVADHPTPAWFETWHAVHGNGADPRPEWDMLARVGRPSAYACVLAGGEIAAVGRAVADDGWAGVFGMATLPHARGTGAGRAVLAALAGWAGEQGADRMYLQVDPDNVPAVRLYERAGFAELCGYHYRTSG